MRKVIAIANQKDGVCAGLGILASGTIILCLYNEQNGKKFKKFFKWFFYLFYPMH